MKTILPILFIALVFHSFCAVNSLPQVFSASKVSNSDNLKITIKGSGFTSKPNAKPLLYWHADFGTLPISELGRKSKWDSTFSGSLVNSTTTPNVVIAKGSKNSLRHDHGSSEAAVLSRVTFNSSQVYVWRKRYDAFSLEKDNAIRTRYNNAVTLNGHNSNVVTVGMWMTTLGKEIWAQVNYVTTATAFYSASVGNVNLDETVTKKYFKMGTPILFYDEKDTQFTTPLINATTNEGAGIYFTFNHKIFRMWVEYGVEPINLYTSLDRTGMTHTENNGEAAYWRAGWMNKINPAEYRWVNEEFQYQSNSVDGVDGIYHFWQDNVRAWNESKRFKFRTSANPKPFSQVYQTQVSNGAQPNSFEYFDSLYVDDSWHRVLIGNSSTFSNCSKLELVIPSYWDDSSIEGLLRLGEFSDTPLDQLFIYVVDGNGNANQNGFRIRTSQPISIESKTVKEASNGNRAFISFSNTLKINSVLICLLLFSLLVLVQ